MSNMNSNVRWQEAAPSVWVGEARGFNEATDPTVTVLGGVHGDEQTGIQVVRESLEKLNIDQGRVILGLGNLAAMNNKPQAKRYITHNLNRQFVDLPAGFDLDSLSPEQRRAQELMQYLRISEASLDLHDFTNRKNSPFLITNNLEIADAIGAPIISTGWDKTEPGGSDGFMATLDKIGLCYELGYKADPKTNMERGHGAVQRFLMYMGVVEGKWPGPMKFEHDPVYIHNEKAYRYKGDRKYTLLIPEDTVNFSPLEEGQQIARINGGIVTAKKDQVIIFPTAPKKTDPGDEAFSVGRRFDRAA